MSKAWSSRSGGWVALALLLGMGFGACGGKATDSPDPAMPDGVAGTRGGGDRGGSGGTHGTLDGVGASGHAGEGEGGSRVPARPVDLRGEAGAPACGFDNECGGCTQEYLSVLCSWGEVELPWELADELSGNRPALCLAAQQQYAQTQSNGGGAGAGAGGEAGAVGPGPMPPSMCATYHGPGRFITSCERACTETADIQKRGQCFIGGECCVVVGSTWCGI